MSKEALHEAQIFLFFEAWAVICKTPGFPHIIVNMEGVAASAGNGGNAVNELSLPELYAELSKTGQTPKHTPGFVCGTTPSTHAQNELERVVTHPEIRNSVRRLYYMHSYHTYTHEYTDAYK